MKRNRCLFPYYFFLMVVPLWAGPKLENKLIKNFGEIKIPSEWIEKDTQGEYRLFRNDKEIKEPVSKLEFLLLEKNENSFSSENGSNFDEYLDKASVEIQDRDEIAWPLGQNGKAQIYKFFYKKEKLRYFFCCAYREMNKKNFEYVVMYSGSQQLLEENKKSYEDSFKSFKPVEPTASDPEKKEEVSSVVVEEGWYAISESKNYVILSDNIKIKRYVDIEEIKKRLESMRKEYEKEFQPYKSAVPAPETAKEVGPPKVKIFVDKNNFIAYIESCFPGESGENTVGYYNNSKNEILLLFKISTPSEMFPILYRESFKHYIYHFFGEIIPAQWFNAGFADYFAGALLKNGKFEKIEDLKSKQDVRKATQENKLYPLSDLITQSNFNQNSAVYYPESCVFIYFLKSDPKRKAILKDYIEGLLETKNLEEARNKAFKNEKFIETLNQNFLKFVDDVF